MHAQKIYLAQTLGKQPAGHLTIEGDYHEREQTIDVSYPAYPGNEYTSSKSGRE